jgi:hypothetical protein
MINAHQRLDALHVCVTYKQVRRATQRQLLADCSFGSGSTNTTQQTLALPDDAAIHPSGSALFPSQ